MVNDNTIERPVRTVPRIDFKKGLLVTPSETYFLELDFLAPKRFMKYEEYSILGGFGVTLDDIFDSFKEIYEVNTKGNSVLDACHISSNVAFNGMNAIKNRKHEDAPKFLWFATLFLNTKDEDITDWNMEVGKRKVIDWVECGVPMEDFFLLYANIVKGYTKVLNQLEGDPVKLMEILEAGLLKLKLQEEKEKRKSPKPEHG